MAVQTDFIAAVNQIAAERGISGDEVLLAVAEAIKTSFRSNFDEESNVEIEVEIDTEAGTISVFQIKTITDSIVDEDIEITLKEAKKLNPDVKLGDTIQIDITPEGDFGRVAAQSAKQVILQKIRESERETQLKEFTGRIGEVEYAVVQRMDGDSVIWEVGKTIAIMPAEERIVNEFYRSGDRHKVLLKEIAELPKGKSLIVSRSHPDFLKALFELEVPELTSESIEIMAIAREAGSRSKVAVKSNVQGIDPIGSFVGQRGMRINSVMNELRFGEREEKLDIILWDENIEKFLSNSLSPAEVKRVEIDEKNQSAKLYVVEDQLSLAIGKDGQNVRLAAKLTNWKLDILGLDGETAISFDGAVEGEPVDSIDEASASESEIAGSLSSLGLSARVEKALLKAGIKDIADLEEYKDDYTQIEGIAAKSAEEIVEKMSV